MKHGWVLLLVGGALAAGALAAPGSGEDMSEKAIFPYPVTTKALDNGFHVSVVETPHEGIVAYYTVVRTGSRNEVEAGKSGFAHFFEHMMFRGTKRYSEQAYNLVLKELGADSNAFTTDDWTCYHTVASSDALETLFDIESDRFQNLEYDETDFQKEARAVLGEYNKNASSPFQLLFEKMQEAAYTTHTYQHTTMGFLADIRDMPNQFEYSRKFFERWYRPENCWLVVVGDVEPEKAFALAETYYGGWSPPAVETVTIPEEPPQTEPKDVELTWHAATLPILFLGWHAPGYDPDSRDILAMDVLSQLLFSETSPLFRKLVLEDQSVEFVSGGLDDHRDPYLFQVLTRVKEEKQMGAVEASILAALEGVAKTPPAAARLDGIKAHMRYSFLRGLDAPDDVAQTFCHYIELTGDPGAVNRAYQTLAKVTPEDVSAVAGKIFRDENRTRVVLRGEG